MRSQRRGLPRVRRVPRSVTNDADDAVRLSSAYGLTADDWQEDVLESWLGRRRDDRWSAATCGLAVPRQNGKNGVIEIRELYGMAILGERFLHTAHEVKTARKAFLRIASFFENEREYPELAALVKDIRKTNGQEAVLLTNGGGVEFIARSKGSGRGFTVDVLVCDEAQDLTDEELAALLPTISAAPSGNPQVILTGTPPDPVSPLQGEVFRRVRADGEANRDSHLAWTDFGPVDGPLPDVDDRSLWEAHNPALGIRLAMREVEREHSLMSPETFARERYGWWGDPNFGAQQSIFPTWGSLTGDPEPIKVLGIAADTAQKWLRLGFSADTHVGLLTPEPFDESRIPMSRHSDFVEVVARIARPNRFPVAIQVKGPAWHLRDALQAAGCRLHEVTFDDFVQASADLLTDVERSDISHDGDPDLQAAVEAAEWRTVSDRLVISRREGDIAALESVMVARQAVKHPKRAPKPIAIWG